MKKLVKYLRRIFRNWTVKAYCNDCKYGEEHFNPSKDCIELFCSHQRNCDASVLDSEHKTMYPCWLVRDSEYCLKYIEKQVESNYHERI